MRMPNIFILFLITLDSDRKIKKKFAIFLKLFKGNIAPYVTPKFLLNIRKNEIFVTLPLALISGLLRWSSLKNACEAIFPLSLKL